ncbi:uncharacterized protein K489DRAFT_98244 [Dissoconium aciculare CBS 342.82]|uniref:Uncharacterized protein n=1 Tax=Dissoconium aciculare CBS 342.82 TaxID=1314786 RepID=A0A6J3MFX2_9PEZI|nr:uncharacterized protein K489DRAFT_98244 [Dissoconium aciculare CBS 342.82]KAF1825782.1 hypothetical protein K489DRAFT_98244 [Dissoconium aciculare CBS 342.82]
MATFLDDSDETSLVSIPLQTRPASDHISVASAPSVSSSTTTITTVPTTGSSDDGLRSSCSISSSDTASITTTSDDSGRDGSPTGNKLTAVEGPPPSEQPLQGTAFIDEWEAEVLDYAIPTLNNHLTRKKSKTAMKYLRRDSRESLQVHQRRRSSSWSGQQRPSTPEIEYPPMQSLSDIASESSISDLSETLSTISDDDDLDLLDEKIPPAPLNSRTVLVAYCNDGPASLDHNPDTTVLDMLDLISCLSDYDPAGNKTTDPPSRTVSKRMSHQSINASSRKLASLLGPDFHGKATKPSPSAQQPPSKTSLFRRRSLLPLRPSSSSASLADPVRRASGPASPSSQPSLTSSRSCDFRESTTLTPRSSFLRASAGSTNPRNSFLSVPGSDIHHHPTPSLSRSSSHTDDGEDNDDENDDLSCAAPPDIPLAPTHHHHFSLPPHPLSSSSSSPSGAAGRTPAAAAADPPEFYVHPIYAGGGFGRSRFSAFRLSPPVKTAWFVNREG